MSRNDMPKKKQIADYWNKELQILLNFAGFELQSEQCFACGNFIGITQRCHIVSVDNKGSHHCSNLHLLCKGCHSESEYMDIATYWKWFFYQFNNNFWMIETLKKIELGILRPLNVNTELYNNHQKNEM